MSLKNKEARAAYHRAWKLANRERQIARGRAYYLANKERLLEGHRNWYLKNKAKVAASNRSWALANPEKVRAIKRKYRSQNKEKLREKQKSYYEAHKFLESWRNSPARKRARENNYRKHRDMFIQRARDWVIRNRDRANRNSLASARRRIKNLADSYVRWLLKDNGWAATTAGLIVLKRALLKTTRFIKENQQ